MEVLGTMYKYGIGVKQDYSETGSWFRKAAEEASYSMLNMGKLYEKGNGVTQDDAIAGMVQSQHWQVMKRLR